MEKIRLQKYLSLAGVASRRAAERMIASGRVTVNGETASVGDTVEPGTDLVSVDGTPVKQVRGHTYILLNKPVGYVSTASDEKGRPTVCDLTRDAGVRIWPVGRLDMYSDGLIIMTDDGELTNALTHPSHGMTKTYVACVTRPVTEMEIASLAEPVEIDGRMTAPATVKPIGDDGTRIEFILRDGRNRQIRRLCERCGLKIKKLTRVMIGELSDHNLAPGKWRYLTDGEIGYLKEKTSGGQ
jgi:23S rRNA pseudouridine2605 synthase